MNSDIRKLAILLVCSGYVVASFSGLIVRLLEVGPMVMNFYRALFLMCAVMILLAIRHRGAAVVRVIGVGWPGLLAGMMLAITVITFIQSLTHTTVANTLFVLGAIPFVTAALAWMFLSERPNSATLVTMAIAFGGIVIMIGEGFTVGSAYGNVMAVLATLCFAIYAVLVRRYRQIDMLPAILISTLIIMAAVALMRQGELEISRQDLLL